MLTYFQLTTPGNASSRAELVCLQIDTGSYHQIQEEVIDAAHARLSSSICFANAHMVVEAIRNHHVAESVNNATWVVADGVPLVWAIRAIFKRNQERVTGLDFLPDLLHRASQEGLSVYFYGSTPEVLQATLQTCQQRFPTLRVAGTYSPPFRSLTPAEEDEAVEKIVASGARLVFVALGCPRQELWIARMRHRIPAVLLGIGGALPVLAGQFSRAPIWMQMYGLEWLYRLIQEPTRLFRRYLTTNALFIFYLFRKHLIIR